MNLFFRYLLLLTIVSRLCASEEPYLTNIRQLTFPSMNFEKAGEAYFSPDEQSIIFQAVPDGKQHYQIYVMNIDEGIPKLVSTGKGACTCGFFRPDGNKILFASSHETDFFSKEPLAKLFGCGFSSNFETHKERSSKQTDDSLGERARSETENGRKNAPKNFASGSKQYKWDLTPFMNIYEADLDGSHLRKLTNGPAYHAECSYSPDASEILYASNEDGSMNLFVMDADGTNIRQITKGQGCYNGGPFFSPDGSRIIFRADREKAHYLQIYVVDRDGTNERQITNNDAVNWAPYWHPNGSVIAYTTSLNGHHQYEIYLINCETGFECRLTNNPSFDGLPVFNNDGTKIMWTSKRGQDGSCQIFIADFTLPPNLN